MKVGVLIINWELLYKTKNQRQKKNNPQATEMKEDKKNKILQCMIKRQLGCWDTLNI